MNQKLFTRNFTFLIFGQISSLIGNFSLKFALSMYILEQTGSASVFAGLLALSMLPTVFLSPFGGILADRANRRNIMVALDLLSGLSVLIASFAVPSDLSMLPTVFLSPFGGILADRANRRNIMVALDLLSGLSVLIASFAVPSDYDIIVIGALLLILSALAAFESPTVQACIPQMLSGDNVIKGNAIVNQVASIASLLTPFLGSIFYTRFGIRPVFYAAVICFFVTAFLECFIRLNQVASIASLLTPFLGSIFYTRFGIRPVFYAAVICFFVTAFLECFIRLNYKKPLKKAGITAILKEDFSISMRFLRYEQPGILKLLLLAASVSLFVAGTAVVGFPYLVRTVLGLSANHYGVAESAMGGILKLLLLAASVSLFVAGTAVVGFPYLVRTVLGLSANHYGVAESAMGIASVLGSILVVLFAKKLQSRHLILVLVSFGICLIPCGIVFMLPLHTFTRYLILLLMFCACQLGCSLFSTYAISLIQERTPEHLMGKVMSYVFSLSMCAQPAGQIIYGALGCSLFSTYAISLIQERTPEHLMGKVMSYVFSLSMCAQPAGQIIYGALFDYFSNNVYLVLIPSGLIICLIGLLSRRLFTTFEA